MAIRRRKSHTTGGLHFYEEKGGINLRILHEILLWIVTTFVAVALAYLLVRAFGFRVAAQGAAMEPEITDGENVLVNRVEYNLSSPQRRDVIAFYAGGNAATHPYIRRVAAVPGETVQIVDGQLLINGVPDIYSEDYGRIEDAGIAAEPVTLSDGEYFVLGDNRNESEDSRNASIGVVDEEEMIGKVWLALPYHGVHMHRVR